MVEKKLITIGFLKAVIGRYLLISLNWSNIIAINIFQKDLCDSRSEIDAFMISMKAKVCILGPEITVHMEENMLEWQLKKFPKYNLLQTYN